MDRALKNEVVDALGLGVPARVRLGSGTVLEEYALDVHRWRGATSHSLNDDCRKGHGLLEAPDGSLSCLEVEVTRRLRDAGGNRWQVGWVQAFPCGRNRWREWVFTDLPSAIWKRNRRIQIALAATEHRSPKEGVPGHPDVAVARGDSVVYIECKTTDSLGPQAGWIETGLRLKVFDPGDVIVVRGAFVN